jgi:hypothetical protein
MHYSETAKVERLKFESLDKWIWVNWRWVLFFSQVLVSLLTLGFCFFMIGKFDGSASQKAYWPIVTIIVGCEWCAVESCHG